MRAWIIEWTEQVMEGILERLGIQGNIYPWIGRAIEEHAVFLRYAGRLTLQHELISSLEDEVEGYIAEFQLEQDAGEDRLEEVTCEIMFDNFLTAIRNYELYLEMTEELRQAV